MYNNGVKTALAQLNLAPYEAMYDQHDPAHNRTHMDDVRRNAAQLAAVHDPQRAHLTEKYGPRGTGRRTYFPESDALLSQAVEPLISSQGDISKLRALMEQEKQSSALYHYGPPDADLLTEGLKTVHTLPSELEKYRSRSSAILNKPAETLSPEDIVKALRTMRGEGGDRMVSLLRAPVAKDDAHEGRRAFDQRRQLYKVDYERALADGLIDSAHIVEESPRSQRSVDSAKLVEALRSAKGFDAQNPELLFAGVPHAFAAVKDGTLPGEYLEKVEQEKQSYARGIPKRKTDKLPTITPATQNQWILAIQEHKAKRAGKHFDLRLVDPDAGKAHSWAIPKARMPGPGQKRLAIQTFTHTPSYALNFGVKGPVTIGTGYGKGTVEMYRKEPVELIESNNNMVRFSRGDDRQYVLKRTKKDKWLLMNVTKQQRGKTAALTKVGLGIRQMQRIMTALSKTKTLPENLSPELRKALQRVRQQEPLENATLRLENLHRLYGGMHPSRAAKDVYKQLQTEFSPIVREPGWNPLMEAAPASSVRQWLAKSQESLKNMKGEYRKALERGDMHPKAKAYMENHMIRPIAQEVQRRKQRLQDLVVHKTLPSPTPVFTSGRHTSKDIQHVQLPSEIGKEQVAKAHTTLPGANPKEYAWRGGDPVPLDAEKATWISGLPQVSAGYVDPGGTLIARKELVGGPWTKHVAKDTQTLSPEAIQTLKQYSSGAPIGSNPYYEKVITPETWRFAPVRARFKRIDPDDPHVFMRTFGNISIGSPKGK